jgi:hypothetical protein
VKKKRKRKRITRLIDASEYLQHEINGWAVEGTLKEERPKKMQEKRRDARSELLTSS